MCLLASTSPSKVLRRSQFALKEKIEDDEGGDESAGNAKAEAKAKGKPSGKAKAKGRPKGKAKVQAKKGNKPKDKPIQEEEETGEKEEDEIAEPSDNTTPGVPENVEEKTVPKDDDVAKEDCPKDDDDVEDSKPTDPNQKQDAALTPREPVPDETTAEPKGKAKATKKRKAKEVGEEQQDHSAGSEPTKPVRKRRTAKGDEGKDGKPAPADPAKAEGSKRVTPEGEVGKEGKKRAAGQVKAEGKGEEDKVKKKRVRSDVPATFARRVVPTTPFGKNKWCSLRSAFQDLIRPTLKHYSTHEDPWWLSFMCPMFFLKKCISESISTNVGETVQKFPCISLPTFIPRYVCSAFCCICWFLASPNCWLCFLRCDKSFRYPCLCKIIDANTTLNIYDVIVHPDTTAWGWANSKIKNATMDVGTPLAFGPVRTSSGSSPPMLGKIRRWLKRTSMSLLRKQPTSIWQLCTRGPLGADLGWMAASLNRSSYERNIIH